MQELPRYFNLSAIKQNSIHSNSSITQSTTVFNGAATFLAPLYFYCNDDKFLTSWLRPCGSLF